jgi:hypothetical protein
MQVLVEKLVVTQLVKKFTTSIYGTQSFSSVQKSPSLGSLYSKMNPAHHLTPSSLKYI